VVFDEHLNRQHRLTYFVRGPEWAFAIPQGDLVALEDVMRRCASFWNGVGSALIPVTSNGRVPRWAEMLLKVRPVDTCFMHHALGEAARKGVQQRVPGAVPLWDSFDDHEIHPLHLLPQTDQHRPKSPLEVPHFRTAGHRRTALAVWGFIPDEELPAWRDRYDVATVDGDDAYGAMLRGQIDGLGNSPLRLSSQYMGMVWREGLLEWPYIWILPSASFDSLLHFWNFRARLLVQTRSEAQVIGLPSDALRSPDQLGALTKWLVQLPGSHYTPDVCISCLGRLHDEVRSALSTVSLVEETEAGRRFQFGRDAEPNDPPTFAFTAPDIGGRFIRGNPATTLVSFNDGECSLALPAPQDFAVRTVARARLILQNLPLPLPVTRSIARRIYLNAEARDGVMLLTNAPGEWNFDIRLPAAGQALQDWTADKGVALSRSQDGRDADALLRRLGNLDALDVLADSRCIALLTALAPTSRVKLARRLVAETREAGTKLDESVVLDRLADLGLFLEIEARTAGDIATAMEEGTKRRDVIRLLPPLVNAGFVRRAGAVRCTQCRFQMLLDLRDLDEMVRCRACGELLVFPVVDDSGEREPEILYRLDGLMARVMDQDILPVLLTMRAVRPALTNAGMFFAWPGVELAVDGDRPTDIDLLVSDGRTVWCYEVKNNAKGLKGAQLRRLIEMASKLNARPGIAALEGKFSQAVAQQIASANGRVLTRDDLLTDK
jgi:hypothetical protein